LCVEFITVFLIGYTVAGHAFAVSNLTNPRFRASDKWQISFKPQTLTPQYCIVSDTSAIAPGHCLALTNAELPLLANETFRLRSTANCLTINSKDLLFIIANDVQKLNKNSVCF
jgi:hypothetical protein